MVKTLLLAAIVAGLAIVLRKELPAMKRELKIMRM
jgi:hypothetical protein